MSKSLVVRNIDNVYIAVNEVISRFTVNRNIRLLLENDRALFDFYKKVFAQLDIQEYIPYSISHQAYDYDDLIWFVDTAGDLWLLKNIISKNENSPQLAINDQLSGMPNFEKYGWENQNEYVDIFKNGILEQIEYKIRKNLHEHTDDITAHPFGKLTVDENTEDYIGKKLLLRDMSNIREDRQNYFFPYMTGRFQTQSITNGIYRIWDCGIIEFDIVFRLGYKGTNQYGQDVLSCNDVVFRNSAVHLQSSPDYNENYKYFQTTDDMRIFQNPEGFETYQSENSYTVQGNRNKYVNTYFAELNLFPQTISFKGHKIQRFKDLNYMIFCQNEICQAENLRSGILTPSVNAMTWCNKGVQSVTAVYITMPMCSSKLDDEYINFAKHGGLASNSFSCHIIGRWDTSK